MRRLFVIGASLLQLPAIKKAKKMGFYVGVADYDPNAIGVIYADEYYNVSTIDEEGIYRAAKEFNADGIMTLATDFPMRSVAFATKKLGLVGIDYNTSVKATNKRMMLKTFDECHINIPWFYSISSISDLNKNKDKIKYPCICKPTESSGSRGVILIKSNKDLFEAIEYSFSYSRNHEIIVEEYMEGIEVSVEVLVINKEVYIIQITDKITSGAPYFVELGHTQPSRLKKNDLNLVEKLAKKAVIAIGIMNGAAHVEIMVTKDGPKVIEIGARLGGDYITSHLVPISTGIDMIEAAINISLGLSPIIKKKYKFGSAIRFIECKPGYIKKIIGEQMVRDMENIVEICFFKKEGEYVNIINNSSERVGYIIARGLDADSAERNCIDAMNLINIDVAN